MCALAVYSASLAVSQGLASVVQVRDAAALLHAASARMQAHLQASNQFLAQAAQLQPTARLLPAPYAAVAAGAVFACDVSFPGMHVTSLADVQVLVGPNASVRAQCHVRERLA